MTANGERIIADWVSRTTVDGKQLTSAEETAVRNMLPSAFGVVSRDIYVDTVKAAHTGHAVEVRP